MHLFCKKSPLVFPPVELLAGDAGEVELVADAAVLLRVAVVVQLALRVAAEDVPRRVQRGRVRPERAVR